MRSIFSFFLVVTLVFSGTYFYYTLASICQVPITYQIGTFDERFDITLDEARVALSEAEAVWEDSTGRNLFIHQTAGEVDVIINFVFDDRQERAIAEEVLRESLDQKEQTSEAIGAQYNRLNEEYRKLQTEYTTQVANYESRLSSFNSTVAEYNKQGGAPADVFDKLKAEEKLLAKEASALESRSKELSALAKDINEVSERGNRLIEQYNAGVEAYNHDFAESSEFTQGDYQGKAINIYKFKDRSELVKVLAHEFGHAIDIDHVEGPESIMYYLMEEQPEPPALSAHDLNAFIQVCGEGTGVTARLRTLMSRLFN